MSELTKYELFDVSGEVFEVQVSKREAALLDLHHLRRAQLIEKLKKATTTPIGNWAKVSTDASMAVNASIGPNAAAKGGVAAMRAAGKKGASWPKDSVQTLLNTCLPHRKWLRVHSVNESMWQRISDDLWDIGHDYSWSQIKEKFRNLKRVFKEAKAGLHHGDQWVHFWLMTYIFDEEIVPGNSTLAPSEPPLSPEPTEPHVEPTNDFLPGNSTRAPSEPPLSPEPTEPHVEPTNDFLSPQFSSTMVEEDVHEVASFRSESEVPAHPTWTVLSPSKKKLKSIENRMLAHPASPRKTPTSKRKVAQKDLVWPVDITEKFVAACVGQKADLCEDHVPLRAWKNIAETLNEPQMHWKVCEAKFASMKKFFMKVLPKEGYVGATKWPHYDSFSTIFPADQVAESGRKMWSENAERLLLTIFKGKHDGSKKHWCK